MTQTSNSFLASGDEKHLINTYVSDMVVLLQHIEAPLESQLKEPGIEAIPGAVATIEKIKSVTSAQRSAFEAHLATLGGSGDHGVKSAWSAVLGAGAAAVNQLRSTKVSKSLRDDYTALSLAAVSYTMLHATAVGIGDTVTADLAKRGLDEIAPLVVHISRVVPQIVLFELQQDGENVRIGAAEFTEQTTAAAWNQ